MVLCDLPSYADEDVDDLKKQIEALQKRVDELESSRDQKQGNNALGIFDQRGNGPWDPFSEMDRIQEEMNRMFENSYNRRGNSGQGVFGDTMSFGHDVKVDDTGEGYEIKFDTAGLDKEKIDIEVNQHSITIKGEQSQQDTEESENRYFSSQSYGSFMKTIPLPVDADTDKMKTEKEGNILVIRIPKKTS
jgi:HSP20 family protein